MKSLLSFSFLLLATLVSAISSTGDRLLAVLDDVAEKASYSKFLGDLESAHTFLQPQLRTELT
jgi:oligosaccharyltransferase complex subunit beta